LGLRRIKSQDGPDLILWGSSTLTSTLLEHGLADEDRTPARTFELVSTKAFPSGIILNAYKVAGPLKTG